MIKVTKYWDHYILDTSVEYYWVNPDNIAYMFVHKRPFWKTTWKPGYNFGPITETHNATSIIMVEAEETLVVNETPEEIMALIAKR